MLISAVIGLVLGGTAPAAAQRDDCAVLREAVRWVRVLNSAEDQRVLVVQNGFDNSYGRFEPSSGQLFIEPLPGIDEFRAHQSDAMRLHDDHARRIRQELELRRDQFANETAFNAAVFEAWIETEPLERPPHWHSERIRAPDDLVQDLRNAELVTIECTRGPLLEGSGLDVLFGEEVLNEDGGITLRLSDEQYAVTLEDWAYDFAKPFFSFIRPGPIAYSADANLALVEVGFRCNALCGAGWLMLLERQADGSWVAIAANMTWIS